MNVYDHYRHKAAQEQARLEFARSSRRPGLPKLRFRLGAPSAPTVGALIGLLCGLLLGLWDDRAPLALVAGLGVVWGYMGGTFVDWARYRGRLVASALRGDPLGRRGARELTGRR